MATIIKPSFSGLATGHARYARLHKFYNFGADNRELVGNVALTVSGAANVTDADVGDARAIITGSSMTQQISIPQDSTVIVVLAGRGGRNSGVPDNATIFGNGMTNNAVNFSYDYGSGGRFAVNYRGASGSPRGALYTNAFTSNSQFATGLAIGAVFADTETMRTSVNGVSQTATNVTASNNFASSPVLMTLAHSVGSTANFALAAIIVLTGISTESELNEDTTSPWAFLQQAPSLTVIDTDDILVDGQQDFTATVTNIPTGEVPLTARIGSTAGVGGTLLTGFSAAATGTPGTFTCTMDLPSGIATGPGNVSSELTITYGVA